MIRPCLIVFVSFISAALADYEVPGSGPRALQLQEDDRSWDLFVRVFTGYDDNPMLIPDQTFFIGDKSSGLIGITAEGSYRRPLGQNFEGGFAMRLDQTFYFDENANDFDLTVINPALFLNYRCDGSMPIYAQVRYDFRYEEASLEGIGMIGNGVAAMIGLEVHPCVSLELGYSHSWEDYDVAFYGISDDRDGDRGVLTLRSLIDITDTVRAVGYVSYTDNSADGISWDYDGYEIGAYLEGHIAGPFFGRIGGSFGDRDYKGFRSPFVPAPGRTEADVIKFDAHLYWVLGPRLTADVYYEYLKIDTNSPIFDSDRNHTGVGLTYRF
ncbi:MAG: hypothetical protein AAGI48_09360 [Verrucomicrobiota bacterium]